MTVESFDRGWPTFWDGEQWRYEDNEQPVRDDRPCASCGEKPTPEGYDHCIGFVEGAWSACCGHGVDDAFVITEKPFYEPEEV